MLPDDVSITIEGSCAYDEATDTFTLHTDNTIPETAGFRLADTYPSANFTTGFRLNLTNYPAESYTSDVAFSISLKDAFMGLQFNLYHNSTQTRLQVLMPFNDTIYTLYDGIHPTLYPCVNKLIRIKYLNQYLWFSVDNTDWITKLDLDAHPLNLTDGIIYFYSSAITRATQHTIDKIYFEPIVVFQDDVVFLRSVYAEQYEQVKVDEVVNGAFWTRQDLIQNNIYHKPVSGTGNVGIGTTNPQYKLHIEGSIKANSYINVDYNDLINKPTIQNSQWTSSGNNIYFNEKVGIGTNNPTEKLEVYGRIKINDNTQTNIQTIMKTMSGQDVNRTYTINGITVSAQSASGGSLGTHTLAIDNNGVLFAWGANSQGQIGNNSTITPQTTPLNISNYGSLYTKTIKCVAGGNTFTMAIDTTGNIHAWGYNLNGQLGRGNTVSPQTSPINITTYGTLNGNTFKAVACGVNHTLVIDSLGLVHSWGENGWGQTGTANITNPQPTPLKTSLYGSLVGKTIVAISCCSYSSIALDSTGQVHTWGLNNLGQLGNNTINDSSIPINISTFGSLNGKTIVAISSGYNHTFALDSTGQLHCWGENPYGNLGNNTTNNSLIPINVSGFGSILNKQIKAVACGTYHTVCVDTTNNIHTWGDNRQGQLGRGNTTSPQLIPINITSFGSLNASPPLTFTSVNARADGTHIIDSSGNIHNCGQNAGCQLGRGNTITPITTTGIVVSFNQMPTALGIGINPNFQLQLSLDSASKPSTTTWTVSSDERLKRDISIADYERCFDIVNKIDLKYYKWDTSNISLIQAVGEDTRKLGWVAQDIQEVFPKSITTIPEIYGLSNVLNVNYDQLYAVQYGALKYLINKVAELESKIYNK